MSTKTQEQEKILKGKKRRLRKEKQKNKPKEPLLLCTPSYARPYVV